MRRYDTSILPISVLNQPEDGFYTKGGKRIADLLLAVVLLPILVPIVLLFWLMIKLDGGPGLYGHWRVGKDGKLFRCWKLRSMCVDSQARLARHLAKNAEAAAEWRRDFKLTHDPRITRIGHMIRKTSLDELPQLWNVLRGEMSFVGPRPVVEEELIRYGNDRHHYLSMKPGVTGLWQVSGRNDVSYDERVRMDVEYAKQISFLGDLSLVLRTGGVVLSGTGK